MTSKAISEIITARGIEELLHFTTSNGLIGISTSGTLLAHSELPKGKKLHHITKLNCPDRSRDKAWHNYVNLSISRINGSFFEISKNRWHAKDDVYWCILAFDPIIMTHEGVYFSTTNNAYNDTTLRNTGSKGLEALFANRVKVFYNRDAIRHTKTPSKHTTCNQAEVLYPYGVPLKFLRSIYVPCEEHYHEANAQISLCSPTLASRVKVKLAPEYFE